MLNYIWFSLILLGLFLGGFTGQIKPVVDGAMGGAQKAVEIALGLIGVMAMWLGVMRLADKAGLVQALARVLRPIMRRIFPDVPVEHPAMGSMIMNIAANMLGLANAATPLGLKAMKDLESLNKIPGTASNAMCTFLAINTSSVQLIPMTAVAILAANKSANPTAIVGTAFLATCCSVTVGVTTAKLLEKLPFFKATPGDGPVEKPAENAPAAAAAAPAEESRRKPITPLGWGILAAFVLCCGIIFARMAFFQPQGAAVKQGKGVAVTAVTRLTNVVSGVGATASQTNILFTLTVNNQGLQPASNFLVSFALPAGVAFTEAADGGFVTNNTVCWKVPGLAAQEDRTFMVTTAAVVSRSVIVRIVETVSLLAIPFLLVFFPLYAGLCRIPVYEEFVEGAKEGFGVATRIIPFLVAMLVGIGMFRGAGGVEMLTELLRPALDVVKFPSELLPMVLIRPLSGSGTLAIFVDLVKEFGPDSSLVRTAGTIFGSTETTFYVVAVYFGCVGVRRTRHSIPAGLMGDLAGIIASVIICRMVFG